MSIAANTVLNHYAQALGQIDKLEQSLAKAIADFRRLKTGEASLDDLIVSDNGWEILPPNPFRARQPSQPNGAQATGAAAAAPEVKS